MTEGTEIRNPQMPGDPLIDFQHVSYVYTSGMSMRRGAAPALADVHLTIRLGEYVAILGRNGSGKSTLARLANGLITPTAGRVLVRGRDTRNQSTLAATRALIGMIFSDPENQIIATTVEDDIGWSLAARGMPRSEIATRVEGAMSATGISHLRSLSPNNLSGGQRQRVAIAGVLALQPVCIVADEPTALLDPQARREMTQLLRELHRDRGLTIVHVTHLLEEVALADRVVILDNGRIALDAPPSDAFADLDQLRKMHLVIPSLAELTNHLRARHVDVPANAITPELLVAWLESHQ